MGPKRSRSGMTLVPPEDSAQKPPALDRTSNAPRRSHRLADRSSQNGLEHVNVKDGRLLLNNGTETALSGLQEMEDQLRNEVKKQKMALKQSLVKPTGLDHANSNPDVLLSTWTMKRENDQENEGVERQPVLGERHTKDADLDNVDKNSKRDGRESASDENISDAIKHARSRPAPVNSSYLPLPWKGRLGYACLNTYLRNSNPPVFSSRTCRLASIIENRHPLRDPSQPAHPTKNRPDKEQPPEIERGQKYVEGLGLANARDIVKMLRWNEKYGIKFMRLSSEMFPFASHEQYGYKLAPFASEVLAHAGRVAGELGHRLTTHPGQFTQLGSPRDEVVRNAVRDLEYHEEMLSLLRLPAQQDKDAVMILHMGGVFGDKAATLDRFRANYIKLSEKIKSRLVLENDDVSWTVHDLLPICEELNIPLVLDYHHHNIMFDESKVREGTQDIMELYPRIKATWDRKGITQKMHYSEPCPEAITPRQRRKHRARVMMLPPCPDTMDLMIEAKDKEQAVFDLMRTYRLPGWNTFNDVVPYEREDENRSLPKAPKTKQRKKKSKGDDREEIVIEASMPLPVVPEAALGMGGPNNRVYWPVGMEEWLRPQKREVKKRKANDDTVEGDQSS